MAQDREKLTHDEFVALLERSLVLQDRADERRYTTEDLVAAARELGVDPEIAREAAASHLARRDERPLVRKPVDTRIRLTRAAGTLRVEVPPLPVSGAQLAPLGFALFWLLFVAFWTAGAWAGGGIFAAFSIPFWIAGFAMLGQYGLPLVRTTVLELERPRGALTFRPFGRTLAFHVEDLGVHEAVKEQAASFAGFPTRAHPPLEALLLEFGTRSVPFLAGYGAREREWVKSEILDWLALTTATDLPAAQRSNARPSF